jgi:protein SCO1
VSPGAHRFLIVMMALASLGATVMITLNVIERSRQQHGQPALPVGGVSEPGPALKVDTDHPQDRLEPLKTLPDFTLTERSGQPLGLADLRGKAWIADFIFTRCGGTCPRMTAEMAKLQKSLANDPRWSGIRLVSFSVDPGHDTPEVLRDYADSYGADATHWLFLTGQRETLWKLGNEGFMLGVGEDTNPAMPIFHSSKFALVDRQGRIRGFYDGLDEEARENLMRDLQKVLAE